MTEIVTAPDMAAQVIGYLNPLLTPPVSSRIPANRPPSFVRVTQVASPGFQGVLLFHGRVVVEAWAATEPAAFDLAADAAALLPAAGLWEVRCSGPGILPPDPYTGTPKFGFTADLFAPGAVSTI